MSKQNYRETIIDVPYHSQRDNMYFPKSTCGSTCLGMILEYLNKKRFGSKEYGFTDDNIMTLLASDDLVKKVLAINKSYESYARKRKDPITGKDTQFNYMNNVFIALGIAGEIITNYEYLFKINYRSCDTIMEVIDSSMPVQILGKFNIGSIRTINHYILIVGYDEHNFICHDPYGDWYSNYTNYNGAFVRYRKEDVLKAVVDRGGLVIKKNGVTLYFSMKPVANAFYSMKVV